MCACVRSYIGPASNICEAHATLSRKISPFMRTKYFFNLQGKWIVFLEWGISFEHELKNMQIYNIFSKYTHLRIKREIQKEIISIYKSRYLAPNSLKSQFYLIITLKYLLC